MAGRHSASNELSPNQREAARLDASAVPASKIADQLQVSRQTVSEWRRDPRYQAHVGALLDEMDRDAMKEARKTREAALRVVNGALGRAAMSIQAGHLSPSEAAALGRLGLDVYRSTSAQTGLVEATEHRVTAGPSPDDDVSLAERLSGAQGYIEAAGDGEE